MYRKSAAKRIGNLLKVADWGDTIQNTINYSKTGTYFKHIVWNDLYPEHGQYNIEYTKSAKFASVVTLFSLKIYNDKKM